MKTVLITGATSGIGLEAAVQLAREEMRVVLVGRDPRRTADAVEQVKLRAGSKEVDSLLCDFESQAEVRKLAANYLAKYDALDVLVNNAGTVYKDRALTEDGIERTFAVDHLGYFLLTNLLLERRSPARIVNVASTAHYRGSMDFSDLGFERGYNMMKAYARAKLGNVLFTRALAKRVDPKRTTVNALHPGAVATNIWSYAPWYLQPILSLAKLFMISPDQGGQRIAYLAASPQLEGMTGLYFEDNQPKQPSKLSQDDVLVEQLWAESARLTKLNAGLSAA